MSSEPILLTVSEVQSLTQFGRTKVYELIGAGKLPIIRIDRPVRKWPCTMSRPAIMNL